MTEVQKFENMTAYAAKRGDKNYLILNKVDREIIIDSGIADIDEKVSITDLRNYYNIKFSPMGKYLMYTTMVWEWSGGNLYDIVGEKIVSGEIVSSMENAIFHFTSDEKNLYICSSVGIASGPGGYVYSVPGFNKKYDLLQNLATEGFPDVGCTSNESNKSIIFKLSGKYDEEDNYREDKLTIEYFLETGLDSIKNGF